MMAVVNKKLLGIVLLIKMFREKKQEISTETCQQNKKKQKENIVEIDTNRGKKMHAKRVLKK